MIRPVDGPLSQGFGENATSKILPGSADYWIIEQFGNYQPDGHTGEDYAVPVGTPIRAVTSGTVLHAGWYGGSYLDNGFWIAPNFAGYCYVINHDPAPGFPHGFIGVYAHGQDGGAKVRAGQRVTEGQVIGLSGNTGGSTGPHLHFEILPDKFVVNGYMYGRVNPENLFSSAAIAPQGTNVKPIKGFLMALTDAQQERLYLLVDRYLDAPTSAIPAKVWQETVARGGKQISVKQELADSKSLAERAAATITAQVALAKNDGLTAEQVIAAVKAGLSDGVTVDVNVNGGK